MSTRIDLPLPFALKSVNAWLFPGSEPALVDCGLGEPESYRQLVGAIKGAGVDPRELRLFITHGHVDHAGNAKRLADDYGVQLHAAKAEAPLVETFRQDGPQRNDDYADAMRTHGMPDDVAVRLRQGSDFIDQYLEDVAIGHDVQDGSQIVLGDETATAINTPGHTEGSMCYWLTEDNQLLSGDTILEHITSNALELLDADQGTFHQYVQTMEACRRYVGVECLPGHLDTFTLTDSIIDRHLELHRQRRARILAELETPRTAWELMPRIFPGKNQDNQFFMGMAEIVGHLHSAELDGLVSRAEADGVRRFHT